MFVPGHDHAASGQEGLARVVPRHRIAPFQIGGPSSGYRSGERRNECRPRRSAGRPGVRQAFTGTFVNKMGADAASGVFPAGQVMTGEDTVAAPSVHEPPPAGSTATCRGGSRIAASDIRRHGPAASDQMRWPRLL